ncbi:MAG: DUF2125 domain-containing protein [Paracoccaceae bacterium]
MVADSVVREGDTLVVTGMKTSMNQDGGTLEGRLEEIRFRDLGNGTVEVTMSDTYPVAMTLPTNNGDVEELRITVKQPGLKMIAGGSATETDYQLDAPTLAFAVQASKGGASVADINATLQGMTGTYKVVETGATSTLDTTLKADDLMFTVAAKNGNDGFDMQGNLAGLSIASTGTFLGMAAMENIAQALRDGFTSTVDFRYGAGTFTIDALNSGKPAKVIASNESGFLNMALAGDALNYGAGGTGVVMTFSGAEIPFPEVKLTYGEASFRFLMPLSASDTPSDYSFLTRIVDLTISDEIWGMIDPTSTLPRDPATVIIDAKGTARLTADLMDESAMKALGDQPPGELHSLDVTNLTAKIAGAELTGAGAFTFDNSDLTTFDGVPAPTGKIDLVLKGGNGLLDKLVAMGIVPQDQAMGARMMIAMFAKPGEGQDVLNSTLEFRDKGFFANGQRLK